MVGISKALIRESLLRNPVGLVNLLGNYKPLSEPPHLFRLIMIQHPLFISGSFHFFSTSQSKQEKNNSNGPKGKTPQEDEGE